MRDMATYKILPGTNRGDFDIAIVGSDGSRQTMLGFKTYAAAEAWIAEDEQRTNAALQSDFRMQWRF